MNWHCYSCDKTEKNREDLLDCVEKRHEVKLVLDKKQMQQALRDRAQQTKKIIKKVKGRIDNLYVESILVDGKPQFLCMDIVEKSLSLRESIETEDKIIRPLESSECGYFSYSFTDLEIKGLTSAEISREELLNEIKSMIDRFLSLGELDKHLILGDILLTYCQEWISTLHFPFFVGETESGKSTALHLAKWLCYRCHLGEDIPMADVYNYLGFDEEGCGTIAEDEAQELGRNFEKMRMYKSSYSKGSKKARIVGVDSIGKHQVFYNTFCPKWFAGERVPTDKGFLERIPVIHMMEGLPQSNIKRPSEDEVHQLHQLRNRLLVWKVQNMKVGLEKFDSGLKQRDQELWEDFLAVVHGTKYFDKCKSVVEYYTEQRHQAIKNSLEAKLFGLVIKKIDGNLELKFEDYWNYITGNNEDLPGKLDDRTRKSFHPEEFGVTITPQLVASIFRDKFQATKKQARARDEDRKQHQVTTYVFNNEIILKLSKKYGVDLTINSPAYLGSQGTHGSQKCEPSEPSAPTLVTSN